MSTGRRPVGPRSALNTARLLSRIGQLTEAQQRNRAAVLGAVDERGEVTAAQARAALSYAFPNSVSSVLADMVAEGLLVRVKQGHYRVVVADNEAGKGST